MQSKKLAKPKPGPPTQRYLDISEIREDVVIMKDGTLRSVILVSSINFALKSEEEQMAIIQAYMGFLNGLEYPIQVVIQSRQMNIDPYIASLEKQQRETKNEALRAQIADYLSFVSELVTLGEVMQKQFFVVVPYDPASNKGKNFFQRLTAAIQPVLRVKLKQKEFEDRKTELMRRSDIILSQLASMGLVGTILDTQGLIELYYTVYNPDVFASERMQDISKLQVEE
ncbi:MAG: hypothetical protein ABIG32_03255 [Candidatus Uhrbacteria bacterium]|nr:hypothetical protein [Patescibacteria group bacterium]MBU1906930.1 hypothetical protein [Patescibacteria group bacterium]